MEFNEFIIRDALDVANNVLENTLSKYDKPLIKNITISNARSWWAQIALTPCENEYNLKVSNVFSEITNPDEFNNKLISTLIHECIHTIPGCWNHKKKFQAISTLVNTKYPQYHIARATSMSSLIEKPREYKYAVICRHCGQRNLYMRKPHIWDFCKFLHTPYTCNICGHDSFEGVQYK